MPVPEIKKILTKIKYIEIVNYCQSLQNLDGKMVLFSETDSFSFAKRIIPYNKPDIAAEVHSSSDYISLRIPDKRELHYKTENKKYIVNPGEYLLVDYDGSHKIESMGLEKETRIQISINKKILEKTALSLNLLVKDKRIEFDRNKQKRTKELNYFIKSMFDTVENKKFGKEVIINSLIEQFLVYLLENHRSNYSERIKYPEKLRYSISTQKALDFMIENYDREISIIQLSKTACTNRADLIKNFKEELGMTPIQFLIKYRIEKAKNLLKDESESIYDVSFKTGFSDMSYFSKIFRKIVGVTPSTYRGHCLSLKK